MDVRSLSHRTDDSAIRPASPFFLAVRLTDGAYCPDPFSDPFTHTNGKSRALHGFSHFLRRNQYNQPMRDARCSAMLYHMLIELEGPAEIAAGTTRP